jgi:hypothetical protein
VHSLRSMLSKYFSANRTMECAPHFRRLQVVPSHISEMNREGLDVVSIRAVPRKCRQVPAGRRRCANTSGTKRLYGVLASHWRQLAEEADETDKKPLSEKIRQAHFLRDIDKAEGVIRELVALA